MTTNSQASNQKKKKKKLTSATISYSQNQVIHSRLVPLRSDKMWEKLSQQPTRFPRIWQVLIGKTTNFL